MGVFDNPATMCREAYDESGKLLWSVSIVEIEQKRPPWESWFKRWGTHPAPSTSGMKGGQTQ